MVPQANLTSQNIDERQKLTAAILIAEIPISLTQSKMELFAVAPLPSLEQQLLAKTLTRLKVVGFKMLMGIAIIQLAQLKTERHWTPTPLIHTAMLPWGLIVQGQMSSLEK
jgi:hypothetical protein